jgi:hypothetical protein
VCTLRVESVEVSSSFINDVSSDLTIELSLRKVTCDTCGKTHKVSFEDMEVVLSRGRFVCSDCSIRRPSAARRESKARKLY